VSSEFATVKVGDLFTPVSGKPQHIRRTVDENPGPYPVYSASLSDPFGHIATHDFEGTFLTWVMNGYGGRVQVVTGKFSATRDRGVLVPKGDLRVPNLTYLKYALQPELSALAVGRRVDGRMNEYTKIYPGTVAAASVPLPTLDGERLNFDLMNQMGERLAKLDELKGPIAAVREELDQAVLRLDPGQETLDVSLGDSDLFRLSIGDRVLRKDLVDEGTPAYSANARTPFGSVASSNLKDFEKPSLLWGIDGIFDWNLIPAGEPFATTDHCGRLQVLVDDIDPEYLYFVLRSTRASYGFDRVFRASLGNLRETVSVPIPVISGGQFDLARQQAVADRYRKANKARTATVESLELILQARLGLTALAS
jgi:hypothetical protein